MNGIDDLEKHCERPGRWLVEGLQVYRQGSKWVVEWAPRNRTTFPSFREALGEIVDTINEEAVLCDE